MKKLVILSVLMILSVGMLFAQLENAAITCSIVENLTVGDTATISINVDELLEEWGVTAFQFNMSFDPEIVEYDSFSLTDISDGGMAFINSDNPGIINVGFMCTSPLSGVGSIIDLDFIGLIEGSTELEFFEDPTQSDILTFKFNNEDIVNLTNGGIGVGEPYGTNDPTNLPMIANLGANYPNPFNPTTTINFSNGVAGNVTINIYNVLGQKVKSLVNEHLPVDDHTVIWNGKDDNNQQVSSGVYFYKMINGEYNSTKKMMLIK